MNKKAIALALLVIGAGLLFWGYQESQVVTNKLARNLTNKWDTETMLLLISGAVCVALGGFGLLRK